MYQKSDSKFQKTVGDGKWFLTPLYIYLLYIKVIKTVKNHLPSPTHKFLDHFPGIIIANY